MLVEHNGLLDRAEASTLQHSELCPVLFLQNCPAAQEHMVCMETISDSLPLP